MMSLTSGSRLGPYEIVSPLGAGGMGEVYKAKDTRLERTVAIKVLPAHLSSSEEMRQRFEREAKTISQLSHPHICALYDVGHQDGIDYLVMEYLEGETLSARLANGPLPLDQALRYGTEIADALDRAHRSGVVHRDLKPSNVMLTKSGVKLLDFGLAKLVAPSPPSGVAGLSMLPTTPKGSNLTAEGTILGTFQYMAPEQLEGKEADARTDIFTFGAVLYEMATGKKAFEGKSQASLIGAILKDEPAPISTIQPMSPPALDRVVKTCLAKEPDERWQTAHDIGVQLRWIAEGSQAGLPAPVIARRKRFNRLGWIVAGLLLIPLLGLGLAFLRLRQGKPEAHPIRFTIPPPPQAKFGTFLSGLSASPDGTRLALIVTDSSGQTRLCIRALESLPLQLVPGSEGAVYPFWSPDSRSIGFFAQGKLKKAELPGLSLQTLCDAPGLPAGGTWNRDGIILFASKGALYRVSAARGDPILVADARQGSHTWPFFLPDGRHFLYLFLSASSADSQGTFVGSIDSQERKRLLPLGSNAVYASGHLLFLREGKLLAQPFDEKKFSLNGEAFRLAESVSSDFAIRFAAFTVSQNAVLTYFPPSEDQERLVWFDRAGKPLGSVGPPGYSRVPALSPDEKTVAVDHLDTDANSQDIWLVDLSRGLTSRLTSHPSNDFAPLWSPDGSRVVFASDRDGFINLYQKLASGGAPEELLLKSQTVQGVRPMDWSPDGRFLMYTARVRERSKLWILPMFGDRQPKPVFQTEFSEGQGQFSPDGRWIAYRSNESGRPEVYVRTFPDSGRKWFVSNAGGLQPRWRRDGREIFYLAPDGKLMAVPVKVGSTFEAGTPIVLFQTRIDPRQLTLSRNHYVVSHDGQRFLINTPLEDAQPAPMTVVLNWTAELKN